MNRQHTSRFCTLERSHQPAAFARHLIEGVAVKSTGGPQSDQFAIAMAGEGGGRHAELAEDLPRPAAHSPDGRLGNIRCSKPLLLIGTSIRRERRVWIDEIDEPTRFFPALLGVGQRVERHRESAGQIAQHADGLRSLTGEQHGQRAGRRPLAEVRPLGQRPKRGRRLAIPLRLRGGDSLVDILALLQHEQQAARRFTFELRPRRCGFRTEVAPRLSRRPSVQL